MYELILCLKSMKEVIKYNCVFWINMRKGILCSCSRAVQVFGALVNGYIGVGRIRKLLVEENA